MEGHGSGAGFREGSRVQGREIRVLLVYKKILLLFGMVTSVEGHGSGAGFRENSRVQGR